MKRDLFRAWRRTNPIPDSNIQPCEAMIAQHEGRTSVLLRIVTHSIVAMTAAVVLVLSIPEAPADEFDLLFSEFDARGMSAAEKRYIQAGLAFEGDYTGLLDGVWGQGSQSALEAYVGREFPKGGEIKPQFVHAYVLLLTVADMVETAGWDDRYFPDLGLSLAAPWGVLQSLEGNDLRWKTESEGLFVEVFSAPISKVFETHNLVESKHTAASEPYLVRRSDRLVTSVQFAPGGGTYLRSDRLADGWASVLIVADDAQNDMLDVIASGIHFGSPRSWGVPEGSLLDRVADLGASFLEAAAEPDADSSREPSVGARQPRQRDQERSTDQAAPDAPAGSGTGFYVNNTDLVTAEHVVAGCERISLEDGTQLDVIATEPQVDLAVLTSPKRSKDWLPVAATGEASLGERAYVLGFPYYGLIGTSLHATTGNVSALTGMGDNPDFISFSAPVQPGNSGGPILNRKGEILGVVSARLSELAIAEATGSLPQNMNYAVTGPRLVDFLGSEGVFFPRGRSDSFNMERGAPDEIQRSIVPVFCW